MTKRKKAREKSTGQSQPGHPPTNPGGHPETLIPNAGRKPAISLSNIPPAWVKFCRHYVIWKKPTEAAEFAGFDVSYGTILLKLPVIQAKMKQIEAAGTADDIADALAEVCAEKQLAIRDVRDALQRVIDSGPHDRRGYADVVNACRLVLEEMGKVQGRGIVNNNNNSAAAQAAAAVAAGEEIPHFFEAPWKKAMREAKTINGSQLGTSE